MDIKKLYRVSDFEWDIPKKGNMNVDGYVFGSEEVVHQMDDEVYKQLVGAASLPGIIDRVIALPNAYPDYGMPYGSMLVFNPSEALVCPAAIGFDINCGIRTVTTNLIISDIEKKADDLLKGFNKLIAVGENTKSKISLTKKELKDLLEQGSRWLVENKGMGELEDLDYVEKKGSLLNANPDAINKIALLKENTPLCSLGGGNHYLELQIVDEVFDIERARVFGIFKNQIVVTFHTGSRGLGQQISKDYHQLFGKVAKKYGVHLPNKELAAVPIDSDEGKLYIGAMTAASNFAYANRHAIANAIDEVFNEVIKDVETNTMYDLGHNTFREEVQKVGSSKKRVFIHRKGCTRGYIGKMMKQNSPYQVYGHPIIISGAMGSHTYILAGSPDSLTRTLGTNIPGAGRIMSPKEARKKFRYEAMLTDLKNQDIALRIKNKESVVEEAIGAYKNIEEIIRSVNKGGLAVRVARLKPIGVLRG